MAMHRENGLVGIGDALYQIGDGRAELLRHAITYGVGDIQGSRPGSDHRLQNPAQEIFIRTAGVFRGKFDIVGKFPCAFDGFDGIVDDLLRGHVQFHLHMDRRGGDKGMDAATSRTFQGFAGAVYVLLQRPGQTADGAVLDDLGHRLHGFKIAGAGGRESGLYHVHAQPL